MKSKILILLVPLLMFLAGCGGGDDAGSDAIDAPVIDNAGMAGMVFAAVNVDASVRSSRIYYYEFAAGSIKELLPSESGNPALFFTDGKVFLFNRQTDLQNVRVFDPRQTAEIPNAIQLPDLTAGDPWDVTVVDSGKTVVLASALGESLDILNYQTGQVSEVVLPTLGSKVLRPHALLRSGAHIAVLHSGTDAAGNSDDTQTVYDTQITGGTLAFVDADQTTTVIDGQAVTGSNPVGFVDRDDAGGATIVGLCEKEWSDCTAGSNRMSELRVESSDLLPAADFPYYYKNQVVDGPASNYVFAHVKDADGKFQVVKIDVQTKAVSTIHTFPDERLYGIAFDQGSRTLFVGGSKGIKGNLALYRDDKSVAALEIDGVLYAAAFVPK